MEIDLVEERTQAIRDQLLALWRASVEATHDFLTPQDIDRIATYVPESLEEVESLAVAMDDTGKPLGFAGVDVDTLEMLFVDPAVRDQGVGRALLNYAVSELDARRLDVNEQNPKARGFYEHCGWRVVGRSDSDDRGEPFPVLHMELGIFGEFTPFATDELTEAKEQIDSTVSKLRETVKTLREKDDPDKCKSQITLAERRIRAFEIASALIARELKSGR